LNNVNGRLAQSPARPPINQQSDTSTLMAMIAVVAAWSMGDPMALARARRDLTRTTGWALIPPASWTGRLNR